MLRRMMTLGQTLGKIANLITTTKDLGTITTRIDLVQVTIRGEPVMSVVAITIWLGFVRSKEEGQHKKITGTDL